MNAYEYDYLFWLTDFNPSRGFDSPRPARVTFGRACLEILKSIFLFIPREPAYVGRQVCPEVLD